MLGPDLPEALMSHCIVPISQTKVFIHGGIDVNGEKRKKAYIMDMTTRTFEPMDDSKYAFSNHACSYVDDKFTNNPPAVIVVGGDDNNNNNNNLIERFNLATMKWEEHAPFPTTAPTNEWLIYQPAKTFFYIVGVNANDDEQKVFQYFPPLAKVEYFEPLDNQVLPVTVDSNTVIFILPRDMRTDCIANS